MCIVASPEGVAVVHKDHPEVAIYAGSLDRELNAKKYILPGLGDFRRPPLRHVSPTLAELSARAEQVRAQFAAREIAQGGRAWTREELMQGFVVDVGDLMKLVMAKAGARTVDDVQVKLAHELSDCLWSVLVLAKAYDVDLEKEFLQTMDEIEAKLGDKTRG